MVHSSLSTISTPNGHHYYHQSSNQHAQYDQNFEGLPRFPFPSSPAISSALTRTAITATATATATASMINTSNTCKGNYQMLNGYSCVPVTSNLLPLPAINGGLQTSNDLDTYSSPTPVTNSIVRPITHNLESFNTLFPRRGQSIKNGGAVTAVDVAVSTTDASLMYNSCLMTNGSANAIQNGLFSNGDKQLPPTTVTVAIPSDGRSRTSNGTLTRLSSKSNDSIKKMPGNCNNRIHFSFAANMSAQSSSPSSSSSSCSSSSSSSVSSSYQSITKTSPSTSPTSVYSINTSRQSPSHQIVSPVSIVTVSSSKTTPHKKSINNEQAPSPAASEMSVICLESLKSLDNRNAYKVTGEKRYRVSSSNSSAFASTKVDADPVRHDSFRSSCSDEYNDVPKITTSKSKGKYLVQFFILSPIFSYYLFAFVKYYLLLYLVYCNN